MSNKQIIEKVLVQAKHAHINLTPAQLVEQAIKNGEGVLTDTGALMADTGEFTGRSPKDKFCVVDNKTENTVWWGDVNQKFPSDKFELLLNKVVNHYAGKEIYIRDAYACADPRYRLNIRIVNETAYHNLFCNNLFLRPQHHELKDFAYEWLIINAPSFRANKDEDGTRQHNFSIIDFSRKIILVGGSGYTGNQKGNFWCTELCFTPRTRGIKYALQCQYWRTRRYCYFLRT